MKFKHTIMLCVVIFVIVVLGFFTLVQCSSKLFSVQPILHNGEKWIIAYYEGGSFIDYRSGVLGMVAGLIDLGWIEPMDMPDFRNVCDMHVVWEYLVRNTKSRYITFCEDAFWSAGWNDSLRQQNRKEAIDRLRKGEVDLVIAAGTWAGQDLVNDEHHTPTMVISTSDPIEAGIITGADDSGHDHVIVECDPNRFIKQIELFHDIIGFDRLGVMFEDSEDGRIFSNFSDLEKVSKKRNFKLVVCHADEEKTIQGSYENAAKSYQILAPIVDAMWVGLHRGESIDFLPQLLQPMFDFNVPTWSILGEPSVENGVLLSVTHQDFDDIGCWYAQNIAQILNGTKPRELSQTYQEKSHILINQETAKRIGYKIPETLFLKLQIRFTIISGN